MANRNTRVAIRCSCAWVRTPPPPQPARAKPRNKATGQRMILYMTNPFNQSALICLRLYGKRGNSLHSCSRAAKDSERGS